MIPRTIDYYLARTSDGSTLSNLVHAWVLARAHRHKALDYFVEALNSDVADIQGGTTAEGIHLAARQARSTCCSDASPGWRSAARRSG